MCSRFCRRLLFHQHLRCSARRAVQPGELFKFGSQISSLVVGLIAVFAFKSRDPTSCKNTKKQFEKRSERVLANFRFEQPPVQLVCPGGLGTQAEQPNCREPVCVRPRNSRRICRAGFTVLCYRSENIHTWSSCNGVSFTPWVSRSSTVASSSSESASVGTGTPRFDLRGARSCLDPFGLLEGTSPRWKRNSLDVPRSFSPLTKP